MIGANTPNTIATDAWDAAVANYEALIEPFTRHFAHAALELSGGVTAEDKVIDVAAGTGALSMAVAKAGASLLATDFSPGMVDRLAARLAPFGKKCSARVMDGQALDVADGSFDAAFSIFGVMLFPDWRQGLRELGRVIRPGGRACVAVWTDPDGAGPGMVFSHAYRRAFPDRDMPSPAPGMMILSDAIRFKQEMLEAGFSRVGVHRINGGWSAPSLDWVMQNTNHLYGLLPTYAALGPKERKHLLSVLSGILDKYTTLEGISIPASAHIAVGIKHKLSKKDITDHASV